MTAPSFILLSIFTFPIINLNISWHFIIKPNKTRHPNFFGNNTDNIGFIDMKNKYLVTTRVIIDPKT
jgi:hypothetical protein